MKRLGRNQSGFTIPEVIVAGSIMIILCVGIMSAYVYAIKINRGNNLRMQALAVLQLEVEYYRSLRFTPASPDPELAGASYTNVRQRTSADGRQFNISVVIDNEPFGDGVLNNNESTCTFKQITITAVPVVDEADGWLQNLGTDVTLQRVRSN